MLDAAGGRTNIILADLTNDVCICPPAICMAEHGFDVQVVIDAGGSPTQISDDVARATWEKNGVRTTTATQLVAELVYSWDTDDGIKIMQANQEEIAPTFGKFV